MGNVITYRGRRVHMGPAWDYLTPEQCAAMVAAMDAAKRVTIARDPNTAHGQSLAAVHELKKFSAKARELQDAMDEALRQRDGKLLATRWKEITRTDSTAKGSAFPAFERLYLSKARRQALAESFELKRFSAHARELVVAMDEAARLQRMIGDAFAPTLTHGQFWRRVQKLLTALDKPHLGRLPAARAAIPAPWRSYLEVDRPGLRGRVAALLRERNAPGRGAARRACQPVAVAVLARRWVEVTGTAASADPASAFSALVRAYLCADSNRNIRRVMRRALRTKNSF